MTAAAGHRASCPLPAPGRLTWAQAQGRACVWCEKPLTAGAVSAGAVRDRQGAHVLDTEVWAYPAAPGSRKDRP